MPKRIGKRHIADELRDYRSREKHQPGLWRVTSQRISEARIHDKERETCPDSYEPDMAHGIEMGAAPLGEEKVSAVKKTCEYGHRVSDAEARVKNKIRPHNERRAQEGDGQSAPKSRGEPLFEDEPCSQGHPEGGRVSQERGIGRGCVREGSCPQPKVTRSKYAGQQRENDEPCLERWPGSDARQKKGEQQKYRE